MRKNIVAGNWKMNTTVEEGVKLAKNLNDLINGNSGDVKILIAPPFTHLSEVSKVIDDNKIILAAQNCSTEEKGAFTGEISVDMLKSLGVKAVMLGHSERRIYNHENNAIINKKVKLALKAGITPIYCIGELLEDKKAGKHFEAVHEQIEEGLFDLSADDFSKVMVAYEPVWAIGTGLVASPEEAQAIHNYVRKIIAEKYGQEIADNTTISYGGSCNPKNAEEIFSKPDVDGGLIGGAALEASSFYSIVTALSKSK